jgi:hypothetical protein
VRLGAAVACKEDLACPLLPGMDVRRRRSWATVALAVGSGACVNQSSSLCDLVNINFAMVRSIYHHSLERKTSRCQHAADERDAESLGFGSAAAAGDFLLCSHVEKVNDSSAAQKIDSRSLFVPIIALYVVLLLIRLQAYMY